MSIGKKEITRAWKVGGTLCLIGGVAALLIAGAYAVTSKIIAENDQKAQDAAMAGIYAAFDSSDGPYLIQSGANYVSKYWIALNEAKEELGYIFRADGKNKYGEISLLVGIYGNASSPQLGKISLIADTETFKDKLEPGYVDPYNSNPSETTLADVKCGATHGAELIKDMVTEARGIYDGSIPVVVADGSGSSSAFSVPTTSYSTSSSSEVSSSTSADTSAGGTQ
jgi:hypothetical protein